MYNLIFAIFLGLSCPGHSHQPAHNKGTVTTQDTGGESGHVPPNPPPPPPPPHQS